MTAAERSTKIRIYQPVRVGTDGEFKPLPVHLPKDFKSLASIPGWGLYYSGARRSHGIASELLTEALRKAKAEGMMAQASFPAKVSSAAPAPDAKDSKVAQAVLREEAIPLSNLREGVVRAIAATFGMADSWEMTSRELIRRLPTILAEHPGHFSKTKAILISVKTDMVTADEEFLRVNFRYETTPVRYALLKSGVKVNFLSDLAWPYR